MQDDQQALLTFFLTGRRGGALAPAEGCGLRPALFAAYRDLGALRYDFPVVLQPAGKGRPAVESLSGLFDAALAQASAGADGELVRKQGLRLEREIRRLVAAGTPGTLSTLVQEASVHVGSAPGFDETRKRLRAALPAEGELVDCHTAMPRRLLRHLWLQAQHAKAGAFRARLQRLMVRLSALLRADLERSARGVSAHRLEGSVGPSFASTFDFDVLSRLLVRSLPHDGMSVTRRQRIRSLLHVLGSQRFFAMKAGDPTYAFDLDSCAAALRAWRERLPKLASLVRAMAMAELEVRGEYDAARHDAVFATDTEPEPGELAAFSDYLVTIPVESLDGPENAELMEILSSTLPIKVLLQTDDLAGASTGEAPRLRSRQLASLAMSLNSAYVLQASASQLLRYRERLERGFAFGGPALFSVYSGADAGRSGLPPYLLAAAAMESRVFPAFVYDPAAGANWAARFTLDGNPQLEADWPLRSFGYEDAQHQGVTQEVAFTALDFLALDPRHAGALACVPRDALHDQLVPAEQAMTGVEQGVPQHMPGLWMVDAHDRLHRVVARRALLRQAARCRDLWHSLQELAGIHNSHAAQALARAEREWRDRAVQEAPAAPVAEAPAATAVQPAAVAAPAVVAEPEAPEHPPGEAYIETARCSTCNECVNLNPKMFAYNENKQAYLADVNAGTYAQLVEAAENCQVAVIHPGKPRKGDEPGLDELVKRAEAFA